ncbi:MAG: tail fiber domain-containing protein [Bacteroidetes bacterium]|nr:tail fiber domain-containing protein [Bacteroidota bacterium]
MTRFVTRAIVAIAFSATAATSLHSQTEIQNTSFPFWKVKGNSTIATPAAPVTYGTTLIGTAENWLGTTDDNDVVIGTDNIERMRVLQTTGYVGIGTAAPTSSLMVRTSSASANARVTSLANAIGDPAFQLVTTRGATTNFVGDVTVKIGQAYGAAADITEGIRFHRGIAASDGAMSFVTSGLERARILSNGLVGINATVPATYLDINGDLALREGAAVSLANGANGTIAPGSTSHLRITGPTAAFSIAGITGGVNGKVITLINTTTQDLSLLHSVAATPANGFFTPGGLSYVLSGQYSSVTLIYNSTLARWVVTGSGNSADATDWNLIGNTGINDPAVPGTYGTTVLALGENWLGTTDANDVVIGTNNLERLRVKQSTGNVGIGTAAPAYKLDIVAPGGTIGMRILSGNATQLTYLSLGRTTEYAQIGACTAGTFFTDAADGDMAIKNFNTGKLLLGASFVSTAAMAFNTSNQIGVNTVTPAVRFDVNGDFALREGLSPVFANGVNSNVAVGATSHIRITGPTAAFSITGLAGGVNGKIITLINGTTFPMTISHDVTSLAANRIYVPGGGSLVMDEQYSAVTLMYNSGLSRWVVQSNSDLIDAGDWHTTGNTGTNPSTNFIGTTDAAAWVMRTNNAERARISAAGKFGIGVANPGDALVITSTTATDTSRRLRIGSTVLNDAESGRLTFDEGVNTYTGSSNYCGLEFRHDGNSNRLFLEGACTTPVNVMTFERTGNVGINTADPTQALEIGGTEAQIYMNSATSNMFLFNTNGVAAPAFTTRSAGTKVIFYPQVSATTVDYAMGIAGSTLWSSVPEATSTYSHRWYSGTTEQMRLRGDGRLGIGIAAPTATRLHCYDPSIATTRIAVFRNGNADGTEIQTASVEYIHDYASTTDFNDGANTVGLTINFAASSGYDLQLANNLAAKPTSNAWTVVSDERLKEDIHPFKDGLEVLEKINPVYWKYNGKAHTPAHEYGVGIIAQDMQKVAPYTVSTMEFVDPKVPFESIRENTEQYLAYNSGPLEYVVVNSVKELSQKQKNAEQILANTTEFGSATLTDIETEINYPASFTQRCANVPVVTVSALNSEVQLTITGKSAMGFNVKVIGSLSAPVEIDWIAIAKTNPAVLEVKKEYTAAEREEMLRKVKLTPGRIRLEAEEAEMKRRKAEDEKARIEEERINNLPMPVPAKPVEKPETRTPADADHN